MGEIKILKEKLLKNYFSFICKIPIELNKPITATGIQAARDKDTLSVLPKAKDKSLK